MIHLARIARLTATAVLATALLAVAGSPRPHADIRRDSVLQAIMSFS